MRFLFLMNITITLFIVDLSTMQHICGGGTCFKTDEFPVNLRNLSFSDEKDNSFFTTQSIFHEVDTQEVVHAVDYLETLVHAVDYLETLENLSVGDSSEVQRKQLDKIKEVQEFDWRDHDDVQYFEFSNENDSGSVFVGAICFDTTP